MSADTGLIVFDTNALDPSWPRVPATIQNLLEFAQRLDLAIAITEPTMIELRKRWRERTKASVGNARKELAALEWLNEDLAISEKVADWNQFEVHYDVRVREFLDQWQIAVVPFATTSLETLFRQANERQLVFGEKGKHFQDAVILHSAIEYAAKHKVKAWLVTEDHEFEKRKGDWERYALDQGASLACRTATSAIDELRHVFDEVEQKRIEARLSLARKAVESYLPEMQSHFNEFLEHSNEKMPFGDKLESAEFKTVEKLAVSHLFKPPAMGSRVAISAVVRGTVLDCGSFEFTHEVPRRVPFEAAVEFIAQYREDFYEIIGAQNYAFGKAGRFGTVSLGEFKHK